MAVCEQKAKVDTAAHCPDPKPSARDPEKGKKGGVQAFVTPLTAQLHLLGLGPWYEPIATRALNPISSGKRRHKKKTKPEQPEPRSFCLRMKKALGPNGGSGGREAFKLMVQSC